MKNYIYKLIFPESGKLYIGRATNETRYRPNRPNDTFVGPHHNVEVQNLLDNGEFCYFHVVKVFETTEELELAEDTYLKKVWKTDDFKTRPYFLLNRNRNSIGFNSGPLHPSKSSEHRVRTGKRMKGNNYGTKNKGRKNSWMEGEQNPVHLLTYEQQVKNAEKMRTPEARQKAKKTWEKNREDPTFIHGNTGKPRPDMEKPQTQKQKNAARKSALRKFPCPHCGLEMNAGNLAQHIRRKH